MLLALEKEFWLSGLDTMQFTQMCKMEMKKIFGYTSSSVGSLFLTCRELDIHVEAKYKSISKNLAITFSTLILFIGLSDVWHCKGTNSNKHQIVPTRRSKLENRYYTVIQTFLWGVNKLYGISETSENKRQPHLASFPKILYSFSWW